MRTAGPKLGLKFDVHWWPFFLDPTLPKGEGKDKLEHYKKKFGEFRVNTMLPRMKQVGAAHGLEFNYGGRISNTLDSHRLVAWADREAGHEKADQVREILFRTYFKDNKNIGDLDVLAGVAEEAGLDGEAAKSMLRTEDLVEEVKRTAARKQREWGVSGVPFFVVDDKFAFSGAQDAPTIVHLFQQIVRKDGAAEDSDDDEPGAHGAGGPGGSGL